MSDRVLIPVLLDLTGLRVLFVGAGKGTRTKLEGLVDQDPAVRIVAPRLSPEVRELAARLTDVQVYEHPFTDTDLDGVALVYGMTNDDAVNARVADLCRTRGLWSNVAHHRGPLSFSSPATAHHNGVIAAFSSETSTPAQATTARDAWQEAQK
jgi:precorrin-2 dehydrogenase/sirohydrochlorin ferrochelatase